VATRAFDGYVPSLPCHCCSPLAVQQSIDISCPPGPQKVGLLLWAHAGTVGWTPYRYTDPALHTMWAVQIKITLGLLMLESWRLFDWWHHAASVARASLMQMQCILPITLRAVSVLLEWDALFLFLSPSPLRAPWLAVITGAVWSNVNYDQLKKVARSRLPSVGFRSWSRFLAVSLQVMWVINPALLIYFPQGLQLPPLPLRGLLSILLLGEQRHNGCEQFA